MSVPVTSDTIYGDCELDWHPLIRLWKTDPMNVATTRARKSEETRLRIEREACRLFVEKGIAETTTRDLAAAAGIAEGTIYRHFASKEILALELFRRIHAGLADLALAAEAGNDRIEDKARALITAYCRKADEDWPLFSYHLLAQHAMLRHVPPGAHSPVKVVRKIITEAIAKGEIPDRDVEVLTSAVLGLILQPAISKVYGEVHGPLEAHADWLSTAAVNVLKG